MKVVKCYAWLISRCRPEAEANSVHDGTFAGIVLADQDVKSRAKRKVQSTFANAKYSEVFREYFLQIHGVLRFLLMALGKHYLAPTSPWCLSTCAHFGDTLTRTTFR
uniref:Uncharacterized protein n=1 Tax=mine drainage metagenome TaxID=410659 RepID=E6QHA6_9ZZZZ